MKLPFNIFKWIEENRDLLKPPVGNKQLYKDTEFIIMLVGGPNARKDYHLNESEEFFFQLQGDITLHIQKNGKKQSLAIKEGEIFLLPPNTPHSPERPENTVGLVVERVRKKDENDGLQWYCDNCNHLLFERRFYLNSIENDFLPVFKEYYASLERRTCADCGTVMATDPRFV